MQYFDELKPSSPDDFALAQAVEDRFLDLSGAWSRVRGVSLPIPESLNYDMLRWRTMRVRHKAGDFRNTEAELQSVKAVAQFTLDMNCDLRGQEKKVLQWT